MLLVDLHLGESLDGLAVIEILRGSLVPSPPPAALVTAESGDALQRSCREAGYPLLNKPVRPAALRALIAALSKRRERGAA
jgi:CheY-like chemotaxis protein